MLWAIFVIVDVEFGWWARDLTSFYIYSYRLLCHCLRLDYVVWSQHSCWSLGSLFNDFECYEIGTSSNFAHWPKKNTLPIARSHISSPVRRCFLRQTHFGLTSRHLLTLAHYAVFEFRKKYYEFYWWNSNKWILLNTRHRRRIKDLRTFNLFVFERWMSPLICAVDCLRLIEYGFGNYI